MTAMIGSRWRKRTLIAMLLMCFTVLTSACSTTNNNTGSCNAGGANNAVACNTQTSAAPNSAAADSPAVVDSSSLAPPSSSPPPPASSPTLAEYYLADFNPVQTYGINVDSTPHTVNGRTYNHPVVWPASIGGNDPWWAEWDLSRNCTLFSSPGVGISDDAPSDAIYNFYVLGDGSYKWQKTISLGQSVSVTVSIKGVLRLRLSVAGVQDGGSGPHATWGDAAVWCYSEPPNRAN